MRIEIRDDRVTYAMNKPPGVITAMSDDRNRPTVGDMVGDLAKGLVHVGRLDQDTEGLLLLTTDGELAHRLAHPSYEVRKTYLAQVSGSVPRDLHRRLRAGVELDDGPVAVDSFRVVDTHAGQSVVEVVLHEGRKHIVRRLLAARRPAGVAADPHRRRPDRAAGHALGHHPQAHPRGARRAAGARRASERPGPARLDRRRQRPN